MIQNLKNAINNKRLNTQSFIRKIRIRLSLNKNDVKHLTPTYHCVKKWYGSSYGGFYVNPSLLNSKSIVYSFGIGKDISFDKRIINKHKCQVFGFDPTPKSINFIKNIQPNPLFHFHEFGLSTNNKIEKFFLPVNKRGVSGSMVINKTVNQEDFCEVEMKSLDEIAKSLGHTHIDVLKMDIEGSEYDVLESLVYMDISIKQLLIEFHDRLFEGEKKSKKIVEILKQKGFEIFGASLNYEEISFINTKN